MALDSGKIGLRDSFDARAALQYGKHTIHDFHPQNRVLTVPEIFTYSSNIAHRPHGAEARVEHHKWFLRKVGQLDACAPNCRRAPSRWCPSAGAS